MQVYDLVDLFTNKHTEEVEIYDCSVVVSDIVFKGTANYIPDRYLYEDVCSLENCGNKLILSICTKY